MPSCEAVYICIILNQMGHKQPPTPIQTDSAMADAVIQGKVQPKHTKAMDMHFHWLCDRQCQPTTIQVLLAPGQNQLCQLLD